MITDIFNVLALATICAVSVCRLNLMTPATPRRMKLAYIALAGGAFAEGLAILRSEPVGALHALLVIGIVGVLLTERRRPRCYLPEDCQS